MSPGRESRPGMGTGAASKSQSWRAGDYPHSTAPLGPCALHPCGCPVYLHEVPIEAVPMPDEVRVFLDPARLARSQRAVRRSRLAAMRREQLRRHRERRWAS